MQPNELPVWKRLLKHAEIINRPENHLKHLVFAENRIKNFSLTGAGIFFDYSRQRLDPKALLILLDLAKEGKIVKRFNDMVSGQKINNTENRAALHTAARFFSKTPVFVDGVDVMPEIRAVRERWVWKIGSWVLVIAWVGWVAVSLRMLALNTASFAWV